jgi:hypothetical protein
MSSKGQFIIGDFKASAKWTCILAIPAVLVVLIVSAILGGIHGRGGLPLEVAYAPMIGLEKITHTRLADTPLTWVLTIAIEWTYLFVVVLLSRALFHFLDR